MPVPLAATAALTAAIQLAIVSDGQPVALPTPPLLGHGPTASEEASTLREDNEVFNPACGRAARAAKMRL